MNPGGGLFLLWHQVLRLCSVISPLFLGKVLMLILSLSLNCCFYLSSTSPPGFLMNYVIFHEIPPSTDFYFSPSFITKLEDQKRVNILCSPLPILDYCSGCWKSAISPLYSCLTLPSLCSWYGNHAPQCSFSLLTEFNLPSLIVTLVTPQFLSSSTSMILNSTPSLDLIICLHNLKFCVSTSQQVSFMSVILNLSVILTLSSLSSQPCLSSFSLVCWPLSDFISFWPILLSLASQFSNAFAYSLKFPTDLELPIASLLGCRVLLEKAVLTESAAHSCLFTLTKPSFVLSTSFIHLLLTHCTSHTAVFPNIFNSLWDWSSAPDMAPKYLFSFISHFSPKALCLMLSKLHTFAHPFMPPSVICNENAT